jgi:replicative DNA helicase
VRDDLTQERIPPSNLEAERSVLGACLLDNDQIDLVAEIVRPDDFSRDHYCQSFRAILELREAGKPVDGISFADHLEKSGLYSKLGGDDLLADIAESVPHALNAGFHAGLIKEAAIDRKLIDVARLVLIRCQAGQSTSSENLAFAEREVLAIGESDAAGNTLDAAAVMDLTLAGLTRRMNGEFVGLETGYHALDDVLGGLDGGQFGVIAARPSIGKTALALNVMARVAERGGKVLFVSLEMNGRELGERLLSYYSHVPSHKLRVPRTLDPKSHAAILEADACIRKLPIKIDDKSGRTVSQIAALARRTKSRGGLDLLMIDQLNLIDGERGKNENDQEVISRISRRLKITAQELGVPLIVMHQLNRLIEGRPDKRPMLSDLRSSGQVEADADFVMLLNRPEFYDPTDRPGEADVHIAKNRNGATGAVPLAFRKDLMRFDSIGETSAHPAF